MIKIFRNISNKIFFSIITAYILAFILTFRDLRWAISEIIANKYLSYKMYRLIAILLNYPVKKWTFYTILISVIFILLILIIQLGREYFFKKRHSYISLNNPIIGRIERIIISIKKHIREIAVIALLFLCSLHIYIEVAIKTNNHQKPNIILIYMDALRSDHLSCYGYSRKTTPNIDGLARSGIIFKHTIAQASSTYPSVHSTLTSQYSSNFFFAERSLLEEKHLTLAEILKNSGYFTVAFSSSPVVTKTETSFSLGGFEQGFDIYDDTIVVGEEYNCWWRSPEGIVKKGLEWLENNHRKKFFLFLYIMDPHGSYACPEPYINFFKSEEDRYMSWSPKSGQGV